MPPSHPLAEVHRVQEVRGDTSHPTGVSKKMYPLLTGFKNKTIRYYYSPSELLNSSIFNLDSHTLHLKIVYQTPEIQACTVKIYNAPEIGGFKKGPSSD